MGNSFVPSFWGKDIEKICIGFDEQWNRLQKLHDDATKAIPTYPPYNIRKHDDTHYTIELAVAGFSPLDIDVEMVDSKLIIRGSIKSEEKDNFLFRGIANRAFTRSFILNHEVEVKNAEMINGMLKIYLERIIPEEKKPQKISIKTNEKQFLTEGNK